MTVLQLYVAFSPSRKCPLWVLTCYRVIRSVTLILSCWRYCFQWREASYTRSGGDVVRVYTVCNVAVTAVDNWLRTPFIASQQANRLYVHIEFSMRKCTKYPNPGRLQQCKVEIADLQTCTSVQCFSFCELFCYWMFRLP